MKFCPKCQTKYEEEIIRFCTRDGVPLVEENPTFSAIPSRSSMEEAEEPTVITVNHPRQHVSPLHPIDAPEKPIEGLPYGERRKKQVTTLPQLTWRDKLRKSNTTITLVIIIVGLILLGVLAMIAWTFMKTPNKIDRNKNSDTNTANTANSNANYISTLPDTNLNSNIDTNTNVNSSVNAATNINTSIEAILANLKTPTPPKTPTPKPTPDATGNANASSNANSVPAANSRTATGNTGNTAATPTTSEKPVPPPTEPPPPILNAGILNSRAINLRKPAFPQSAKDAGASGQVIVNVTIDEKGNVTSAKAISGPQLLRGPAEAAARQSDFNPVKLGEKAVKAMGTIVYNFINE